MQTFLPTPDSQASAAILDNARLNKQRLEGLQILNVLAKRRDNPGQSFGYSNHPAVVMWRDNIAYLAGPYLSAVCVECQRRGIRDDADVRSRIIEHEQDAASRARGNDLHALNAYKIPWWLGVQAFHRSHRRILAYKSLDLAKKLGMTMPQTKPPYVWPIHQDEWVNDPKGIRILRYNDPSRQLVKLTEPVQDIKRGMGFARHKLAICVDRKNQPVVYLLQAKE